MDSSHLAVSKGSPLALYLAVLSCPSKHFFYFLSNLFNKYFNKMSPKQMFGDLVNTHTHPLAQGAGAGYLG